MKKILLIDDEKNWLTSFRRMLALWEIAPYDDIFTAETAQSAMDVLNSRSISIVFLDLNMGNESGQNVLRMIRHEYPQTAVVMMTGVSSIQAAVYCMQHGANNYLLKTSSAEEVTLCCRQIFAMQEMEFIVHE